MSDELDQDDERILCPDEACIGTIGDEGRCRVCGLVFDGPLPRVRASGAEAREDDEDDEADDEDDLDDEGDEGEGEVDAWEERELCPDESCIGSIGDEGRCRVCGRASAAAAG